MSPSQMSGDAKNAYLCQWIRILAVGSNDSASLWSSSLKWSRPLLPSHRWRYRSGVTHRGALEQAGVWEINELSITASQLGKYRATKVLTEHITWDLFAGPESGLVGLVSVTLFLPCVLGPVLGMRLPDGICLLMKM